MKLIPKGETRSYKDIANAIGRPNAYRAVANACGKNPYPIVIPCHRVIASDGSIGGYTGNGGIKTKKKLLQQEGVLFV
ncbi:MAG: MGMT family protein [Gammaproteobacteria bacterium]|nr:MGMT family protein [Gammaproteobacteria bacterium]